MTATIEEQVRRVADVAFEQTSAVAAPSAPPGRSADSSGRLVMLVAAALLVAALVGALVIVQVGSREGEPTDRVDFSERFSASGALAEIPLEGFDPVIPVSVIGVDMAAIADLTGLDRGSAVADDTEWGVLVADRTLPGDDVPSVVAPRSPLITDAFRIPDEFADELGIESAEIDAYIAAESGDGAAEDAEARFDAIRLQTIGAGLVDDAGDDGIVDIGAGDDFERRVDDRTNIRPIGRPLRLGVDDERPMVAVSMRTPTIRSWIDPTSDRLGDLPDLDAAATALDRVADIYAFQLVADDFGIEQFRDPDTGELDRLDGVGTDLDELVVIDEPFSVVGVGWSGIGAEQQTLITYVFDGEREAVASSGVIETLYAPDAVSGSATVGTLGDVFLLDDVVVDGRTVTVVGSAAPGTDPAAILGTLGSRVEIALHR